jgi:hypothetical protein
MHKHWRQLTKIKNEQKLATKVCIHNQIIPPLPLLVTITRIGPRRLDDDNLASSCKYVRDQIAAAVGVDDGSDQYTWQYQQKIGDYGVDVEIITR